MEFLKGEAFMTQSSARGCLRKKAGSDTKCDECVPGYLFYEDHSGEETLLSVTDLEKLLEELELKKSINKFVMFIK